MSQPTSYKISVPSSSLSLLKAKLDTTTLPDDLPADTDSSSEQWNRGVPLSEMQRLTNYWRDGFDWRKEEAKLNELPHYQTDITVDGFESLKIHFVWQKSEVKEAIPLLFVHGWPGSFIEVAKLLPLLKGNDHGPAFHVVAPSLPNFGFSEGPKKRGFGLPQYAETCHKVMLSLGYDKYVTQGGDWGMYTTRCIGLLYPEHCLASHINLIRAHPPSITSQPLLALQHAITPYTALEQEGIARDKWFSSEGQGYRVLQGTKPQTLGYALTDPVALLAWIYEKLHDWTDSYPWTDDEILTWVSIYLFSTAGPAASVRIYYEATHQDPRTSKEGMSAWIPRVKLGLSYFPKDIGMGPVIWGKTLGEVVYERVHAKGGHFAAWEVPETIVKDLEGMFGKGGRCEGIVQGRGGYKK